MRIKPIRFRPATTRFLLVVGSILFLTFNVYAEEPETWSAKFQATYVGQKKPSFDAAYSGTNSLLARRESAYSFTATAFLGWRPLANIEIYYNPEVIQGVALARNDISRAHRDYLARGGLGFFLGDGRLNLYRPEDIVETYYNIAVIKNTWVSLDYQHVSNPAYNAERGPVHVGTIRLHLEL